MIAGSCYLCCLFAKKEALCPLPCPQALEKGWMSLLGLVSFYRRFYACLFKAAPQGLLPIFEKRHTSHSDPDAHADACLFAVLKAKRRLDAVIVLPILLEALFF